MGEFEDAAVGEFSEIRAASLGQLLRWWEGDDPPPAGFDEGVYDEVAYALTKHLPDGVAVLKRALASGDEPRRTAVVRGASVDLTPTEWGLLLALATVPGRVYSRFELINRVRGYEFEGYERTVDSHVKNLRRKIEADPGNPRIVQTVLGGGYRLGLARDG